MTATQRIAIALLAFGAAGLLIMTFDSSGIAQTGERPAYFLAISAGPGLRMGESAPAEGQPGELACDTVFRLGPVDIGARCISHGWTVSIER
ncbi:MAG: hypothetical protein NW217_04430 [Hyphomicrobiaceae bacterium]|nr:hypothetical protein [Hyphomicrobiaceae bacterium]